MALLWRCSAETVQNAGDAAPGAADPERGVGEIDLSAECCGDRAARLRTAAPWAADGQCAVGEVSGRPPVTGARRRRRSQCASVLRLTCAAWPKRSGCSFCCRRLYDALSSARDTENERGLRTAEGARTQVGRSVLRGGRKSAVAALLTLRAARSNRCRAPTAAALRMRGSTATERTAADLRTPSNGRRRRRANRRARRRRNRQERQTEREEEEEDERQQKQRPATRRRTADEPAGTGTAEEPRSDAGQSMAEPHGQQSRGRRRSRRRRERERTPGGATLPRRPSPVKGRAHHGLRDGGAEQHSPVAEHNSAGP